MDRTEQMLKSALIYCNEYGLNVLPVKPGTKWPRLKEWKVWQTKRVTETQIKRWWGDIWPGSDICCVCGEISNRIVVDIDSYKDSAVLEKINEMTPEQLEIPIVETPRGGEHRHFVWQKDIGNAALKGIDIKGLGGLAMVPPSGVNGNQYKWREGCNLKTVAPPFLPVSYVDYIKKSVTKPINGDECSRLVTSGHRIKDGDRDTALFHIANCLAKGQMPPQEIQSTLTLIGLYCCDPPFAQKEIQAKVISALKRSEGSDRSWQEEVRSLLMTTKGHVTTTNIHMWLQAFTRREKQSVNMALHRLSKEGFLKKSDSKAGQYRIINQKTEPLDWKTAKIETYHIVLPLGMHAACRIMPKSIITFGGMKSTGKTAFAMNIAALNQSQYEIHYFTSEIIKELFKERAVAFDDNWENWNVNLLEIPSPSDIPDVIKPDGFNIVDYIEPPEGDYSLMTNIMRNIHNNLRKGVAIVFVQKRGDGFVAGGEYMKDKPLLFCHLDKVSYPVCKLTILENKVPQYGYRNPTGQTIEYRIGRDGMGIVPYGKFHFDKWIDD